MFILLSRLMLPTMVTGMIWAASSTPDTYSVSPMACRNTAVWQSVWIVKRVCTPDAPAPARPPDQPPADAPEPAPAEPAP